MAFGAAGFVSARQARARFLGDARGTALALDLRTRRVICEEGAGLARQWVLAPGSTLKPFSLQALLEAGKLNAAEEFPCPGTLKIGGRSFDCSHPHVPGVAFGIPMAIAYSCNCFVAHFAERFQSGELARYLARAGLGEAPGGVEPAGTPDERRLQAIGEARVLVTPFGLLHAYSRLAALARGPMLEGLEGAVEFGTAQLARLPGMRVAGKTGTVRTGAAGHAAWFAGFAPSRSPRIVVSVAVQGRSGGGDAAPIAGRIFAAYEAGRL